MIAAIRTYRIPLIITGLAIWGLIWWTRSTLQNIDELGQERQRRLLIGIFNIVESAIQALAPDDGSPPGRIKDVIEKIVGSSPLRFVVLVQDGKRILETRDAPNALTLLSAEGERFAEGRFLFWRKVILQREIGNDGVEKKNAKAGKMPGAGVCIMIMGGEMPQERHGYSAALRGLFFTLAVALLFVAASLIAWVIVIRHRLLAEQLKTERARLAHQEDLGLAATGLAHETKNPLGIISGIAQQIIRNPDEPEQSRVMLEQILNEVDSAAARLGHFMAFARQRKVNMTSLDARRVVAKVVEILQSEFEAVGVRLEMNCSPVRIAADGDMLRQILVNLLLNSLHASSEGGKVTVRMARHGGRAELVVEDQGSGIPPELVPNIFKPYVAGAPGGHGLGLAIVKRLAEEHGWTIEVDSQLHRGAVVTISGIELSQTEESE